jgi:hypothetical protein
VSSGFHDLIDLKSRSHKITKSPNFSYFTRSPDHPITRFC